jgi:hypothetical protein
MKKNISIAIPGLVGLEKHMEEIFSLSNKLEEKILEAAKIISFPLLDLLSEREAILLLNVPAYRNKEEVLIPGLWLPKTLLEAILIKSIEDAQRDASFSCGEFLVKKADMPSGLFDNENIFDSQSKLDVVTEKIKRETSNFIEPSIIGYGSGKEEEFLSFFTNCNYKNPFPETISIP